MTAKVGPWSETIPKDYARLMREFGIEEFGDLAEELPDPNHLMRRRIIFGHRDFQRVLGAMRSGEKFAVMTGLMPSGRMHLGHKLVVDQLVWYQRHGAEIFLCVADIEAHATRGLTLQDAERLAIEEYLVNFQALGLDLERCNLYFQSRSDAVRNLAYTLGRKVNLSELRAIYGFSGETSASHIFYPLIDVADILHPQLEEFGGPRPTVVPVGIDQDPHLRLARDVASRFKREFGFIPPSSTYHRLLRGLTGGKMSSSNPETAIFLTDPPEAVERKIRNAFTGERPTAKEQRERGGDPDKCVVYELHVYHLTPDDRELLKLREACESGEIICGECKAKTVERLKVFLAEHKKRRKNAEAGVKKLIK